MSKVTPANPQFKEHLGGFFHDLLRAAGVTMTPTKSTERIREIGARMADAIEHAAERKSIQVIKKLQDAVVGAFNKVEDRLNTQSELIAVQQKLIEKLERRVKDLESFQQRKEWRA